MITNTIINNILGIASEIERIGEIISGTNREKQVIETIRGYLENHVDELQIEHVPVTSWHEEICVVEKGSHSYPCTVHPPYQGIIDEEINYSNTISIDSNELISKEVMDNIFDKIVVIDMPSDPDDIATIAYILAQHRPRLIIIRDRGESLRRIVILNNVIALYRRTTQLRIPVIHVRRSIGAINKLVGSRIYAKTKTFKSYGYNVVAKLHKRRDDRYIYITAHHDHWLGGGSDNIIGVSIVTALSKMFRDINIDNSIVLASFTAEEGFPDNITPFYWLVGSRHHINNHADKIIDNTLLAINIDVIYKEPLTASTSNFIIRNIVGLHSKDIVLEHDSIIFDSFPFTLAGIPSITFNTFKRVLNEGIYHSDKDYITNINIEAILSTIENIYMLIDRYIAISGDSKYINVCNIVNENIQSIIQKALPSELLLNLYRICKIFDESKRHMERHRYIYFLNLLNRMVNTTYVSRDIGRRLGIREGTEFIKCDENLAYIPTDIEFKSCSECYRSINFNLELLAYILFKQYY